MNTYSIGFTGTQDGMNDEQKAQFAEVLRDSWAVFVESGDYSNLEFHHGDCIGADSDAHDIWRQTFAGMDEKIIIHPPSIDTKRAFKNGDQLMPEYDYLQRNRDIVNSSKFLIATPKTMKPTRRGGTWYTIRFAAKCGLEGVVITPDGVRNPLGDYK